MNAVCVKGREAVNLVDAPQVRRAIAEAGNQGGVPGHWGLVEYGKGAAFLAAALDRELDAEALSGFVLVDTDTAEGRALLSLLSARADVVVRGVGN